MSKNDMVMVPRELAEAFREYSSWAANPKLKLAHDKLNELLDQPADQHHGEPVALPVRKRDRNEESDVLTDCRNEGWNACLDKIAKLGPLYTHADPGEVERLRGSVSEWESKWQQETAQVGLLRAQLAECSLMVSVATDFDWAKHYGKDNVAGQLNAAIAFVQTKLAERDALLQEARDSAAERVRRERKKIKKLNLRVAAYEAALREIQEAAQVTWRYPEFLATASAEPSAPVEIDERAEFEEAYEADANSDVHEVRSTRQIAWAFWQARAAMERKP